MFLSKIWFVLVALLAGVAITAAFVAPRSADRMLLELEGQRLDRAQYAADQMLRADAHRWMNYAAKLGRDANLIESLDSASKGSGEPRMLAETVRGRVKSLVPDLKGAGIELVGAVDAKGRVVARVGAREGEIGDSIAGAEAIADALRGYLNDDVWGAGDKVLRVAAVPVLSKSRERIVGALFVAAETGKRLAEVWKKNLGVDVAILLKGQVVAASVSEATLSELPRLIEQRAAELSEHKRTRAIPLKVGNDRLFAVAAPFVGEAAEQGAAYALVDTLPPAGDPLSLITSTTADDLKFANFPWIPLAGGLLVILAVGIGLQRTEMEKPLGRLRSEVKKLANGELPKLQDALFPGKFGGIARDVNAALERFTHAPAAKTETQKKDMGAILGGESGSVFDLPASSPFGSTSSSGSLMRRPDERTPLPAPLALGAPGATSAPPLGAPGFGPGGPTSRPPSPAAPATPFGALGGNPVFGTPSPIVNPAAAPPFGAPPAASALGATPQARLASPQLGSTPPAPPSSARPPGPPGAPPAAPPLPPILRAPLAPSPAPPLPALPSTRLPSLQLDALDTDTTPVERPGGAPPAHAPSSQELGMAPPDDTNEMPGESTRAVDPQEAHFREVFAEYIAVREKCGEPIANLTLERFRAKLEDNERQLKAKYNCQSARFSVYVKDGKAAIKATPVK
jgi:hypothetical protein